MLIFKIYYALVDGVLGVDIVMVLFDFDLDLLVVDFLLCWLLCLLLIWVMLFVDVVVEWIEGLLEVAREVVVYLDCVGVDAGCVVVGFVALLVVGVVGVLLSLFNVLIGLHCCFVWVDIDFVSLKVIKDVHGVIVNDAVFVIVVGVLRVHLFCYCFDFEGMELKAMVLILVCADVECGVFGNCVVVMYVLLLVGVVNLVEWLHFVHVVMVGFKEFG